MDRESAYATVVVLAMDAVGYIRAGLEMGVAVETFTPRTSHQREVAIAAHVVTLFLEYQPAERDAEMFIAATHTRD